jgi:hypothetical protein
MPPPVRPRISREPSRAGRSLGGAYNPRHHRLCWFTQKMPGKAVLHMTFDVQRGCIHPSVATCSHGFKDEGLRLHPQSRSWPGLHPKRTPAIKGPECELRYMFGRLRQAPLGLWWSEGSLIHLLAQLFDLLL